MPMNKVILKAGRERSVLRRHPWVFSGAIASVTGNPADGESVAVVGADGVPLATGAFSSRSQISVRIWSFDPAVEISGDFIGGMLAASIGRRAPLPAQAGLNAYRLVNAESDGLPGLVVDRYADFLVCQFLSAGIDRWRGEVIARLESLTGCAGIIDKSDPDARKREGLADAAGVVAGRTPPDELEIGDGSCVFLVNIRDGQKTGFYLDQRENRAIAAGYAKGAEVLDCFCYSGGFMVHALKAGAARVTGVDSSAQSLALARRNIEANGLDTGAAELIEGDVFALLRTFRDSRRKFDLIILDPPKFVESAAQVGKGSRAYKDINLLAFKLLKPAGILCTFSCSGHMPPELFQKVVADAALDAGRDVQIIRRTGPPPDHPVGLQFPEGSYLKGLVCRLNR